MSDVSEPTPGADEAPQEAITLSPATGDEGVGDALPTPSAGDDDAPPDAPPDDEPPAPPPDPEPVAGVAPQDAQPPGAVVISLDPSVSMPGAPDGDVSTHAIVHDDGTTWFHSLGTLPRRFMDEAGAVILGRHLNVTREDAKGPDV